MRMLKRHRLAKGLSLKQLASKLNVHISTAGAWESGRNVPRAHQVPRLARLLEIDAMELTKLIAPESAQQFPPKAA